MSIGPNIVFDTADKAAVVNDMTPVRGNFSVPILIGEFGTSEVGVIVEKAAGWAVCFIILSPKSQDGL